MLRIAQRLVGFEARPEYSETLAMAMAEVGRFDEAAVVQRILVAQARDEGAAEVLSRLSANQKRYEQGKTCNSPW